MDPQNFKKVVKELFRFLCNFENQQQKIIKPKNFVIVLSRRKCWKIEQQLKVEIEDGHKAH